MAGGFAFSGALGIETSAGGLPMSMAMACSSCARRMPRFVSCACAVSNCVSAWATSWSEAMPVLKSTFSKIVGLLVGGHRVIEQLFQRILAAQLKIIRRQFRLCRQPGVFQIGGAGLRFGGAGFDGIANAAPQIQLPGGIQRQGIVCGVGIAR